MKETKINPIINIRFQIAEKETAEMVINNKSELNWKLLTFFHKYNITDKQMKALVKQNVINFIESENNGDHKKIKICKGSVIPIIPDRFKIEPEEKKKKNFEKKKFVKKDFANLLNKKYEFCRRKSGIEKIQFNLKNKFMKKKLNNTNLQNLLNPNISRKSIKTTKKNKLNKNLKIEGLNSIKLKRLDLREIETGRSTNTIKRYHSLTNESPKGGRERKKKKLDFDENDMNWLGTFEHKDSVDLNIYRDYGEVAKTNTNQLDFHTKKNFYNNKFHLSSDMISIEKTLNKNIKTPSFISSKNFSKIQKRGSSNRKNNFFENHLLFKFISKEDLKFIFQELDQKSMGLIGARNLNLRKMSSKNLEVFENVFLHFYNNSNLLFDFEDFVYQAILRAKL